MPAVRLRPDGRRRAGRLHADARRRRRRRCCARSSAPGSPAPVVVDGAVRARPDVPDRVVPEPRGAGGDGPAARPGRRRRAPTSRSPTTPTPTGSARRSRSPTGRGGASAATRSAGCSPTTSSPTRRATTAWSSPRSCRRRCSATMAADARRALRRDVHRVQVDRPHDPRPSRAALRVRLRAGARLPRGAAAARQGRHLGGGAARRGRRASPRPRATTLQGRLDDIAARFGRHVIADAVGADGPGRRPPAVVRRCRPTRRASSAARRSSTSRRSRRPTCCGFELGGRRPRAGPPERHRAEGQALRRSGRRRPRTPTSTPSPPSSSPPPPPNPDFHKQNRAAPARIRAPESRLRSAQPTRARRVVDALRVAARSAPRSSRRSSSSRTMCQPSSAQARSLAWSLRICRSPPWCQLCPGSSPNFMARARRCRCGSSRPIAAPAGCWRTGSGSPTARIAAITSSSRCD